MAAELKNTNSDKSNHKNKKMKPILINKLELCSETIHMALFIPHEDSVVTVSSDKSIRIWIKRDNGQYWPSICHYMPDTGLCIDYNKESGKVFVGLANGTIQEYDLADDCNKLTLQRNYLAHMKNVKSIVYSLDYDWLLSCGNDKYFQWHCTKTGKRIGSYAAKSACTSLQFDHDSCYIFMGDYGCQIYVIKLSKDGLKLITTLKGHSGSIQCLFWDSEKKWLYSGSFDESVIIWDIGGQKGSAWELHGHTGCVCGISLSVMDNKLFTVAEDQVLTVWDMNRDRTETPNWSESDICEKCASPFFWNFRKMWDQKTVGVRQHHCRKCGRAVCNECSKLTSKLPRLGYEFVVRICGECNNILTDDEKISHTTFHDLKQNVKHLCVDLSKHRMLTCGGDDLVKIWDIHECLTT